MATDEATPDDVVYQAHVLGRGADYSWVIGNRLIGVEPDDRTCIVATAQELGVGLVIYETADAYGT